MSEFEYVLGIDTSNYKTSAAIISDTNEIIADERVLLKVKSGERGLRQSDALFQHVNNLPEIIRACFEKVPEGGRLSAVAVSTRPRPVEGSYMPVFNAGVAVAESIAASHEVPLFEFSHQEGHMEAGRSCCSIETGEDFLSYHLSGGTMEFLKVSSTEDRFYDIEIIGATKDISFGQLIDRIGVYLGMQFPAGEEMDRMALSQDKASKALKPVFVKGLDINLSGLETQALRALESADEIEKGRIVREVFDRISDCLMKLTDEGCRLTGIEKVMFAGGVSSSEYIKQKLTDYYKDRDIDIAFAEPQLAQDNAVGTAMLGGRKLWQLNL